MRDAGTTSVARTRDGEAYLSPPAEGLFCPPPFVTHHHAWAVTHLNVRQRSLVAHCHPPFNTTSPPSLEHEMEALRCPPPTTINIVTASVARTRDGGALLPTTTLRLVLTTPPSPEMRDRGPFFWPQPNPFDTHDPPFSTTTLSLVFWLPSVAQMRDGRLLSPSPPQSLLCSKGFFVHHLSLEIL